MVGRSTLMRSTRVDHFKRQNIRIGILHSGGPAPGGNRVLYGAALRAIDHQVGFVGFRHGYEHLMTKSAEEVSAKWMIEVGREEVRYLRF